jgi:DNA-binding NarL/FixJ family response regulator
MATVPIINVAITEDKAALREALKNLIGHFPGMAVVIDAADGRDLLDKLSVASVLPDVILLDINMPRMNGVTASALLAELYPAVRVIVFSFLGEDDKRVRAMMENGCVGYLVKDALPAEIERMVRGVK